MNDGFFVVFLQLSKRIPYRCGFIHFPICDRDSQLKPALTFAFEIIKQKSLYNTGITFKIGQSSSISTPSSRIISFKSSLGCKASANEKPAGDLSE